jgi:16S rRNA processing protein RimM
MCVTEICPETHLAIGKVLKPWGLKGAVKVHSYAESFESFLRISELRAQGKEGPIVLPLEDAKRHEKGILLKFKGRDCVEDVEALVGLTLYMDKKELPRLEEGEYYWYELIGMEVQTDSGRPVGTLEEVLDTGNHDVYVVRQGEREVLVPAVRGVIRKVDVPGKRMIIRAAAGILNEDDL